MQQNRLISLQTNYTKSFSSQEDQFLNSESLPDATNNGPQPENFDFHENANQEKIIEVDFETILLSGQKKSLESNAYNHASETQQDQNNDNSDEEKSQGQQEIQERIRKMQQNSDISASTFLSQVLEKPLSSSLTGELIEDILSANIFKRFIIKQSNSEVCDRQIIKKGRQILNSKAFTNDQQTGQENKMSLTEYAHYLSLVNKLEIYDILKICHVGQDTKVSEDNLSKSKTVENQKPVKLNLLSKAQLIVPNDDENSILQSASIQIGEFYVLSRSPLTQKTDLLKLFYSGQDSAKSTTSGQNMLALALPHPQDLVILQVSAMHEQALATKSAQNPDIFYYTYKVSPLIQNLKTQFSIQWLQNHCILENSLALKNTQKCLLSQFIDPEIQRQRIFKRKANCLDQNQGKMEIFLQQLKKNNMKLIDTDQYQVLQQAAMLQPADMMIVKGPPGSGKSYSIGLVARMLLVTKSYKTKIICANKDSMVSFVSLLERQFWILTQNQQLIVETANSGQIIRNYGVRDIANKYSLDKNAIKQYCQENPKNQAADYLLKIELCEELLHEISISDQFLFNKNWQGSQKYFKMAKQLFTCYETKQLDLEELNLFCDRKTPQFDYLIDVLQDLKECILELESYPQIQDKISQIKQSLQQKCVVQVTCLDFLQSESSLSDQVFDFVCIDDFQKWKEFELASLFKSVKMQRLLLFGQLSDNTDSSSHGAFNRMVRHGFDQTLSYQHRLSGVSKRIYEGIAQTQMREPKQKIQDTLAKEIAVQVLQQLTRKVVFYDLAYCKELGYRPWQDCEDCYFAVQLLKFMSVSIKKALPADALPQNCLLGDLRIGICVPNSELLSKYEAILTERFVGKSNTHKLRVGTPHDFEGVEVDVMIICGARRQQQNNGGSGNINRDNSLYSAESGETNQGGFGLEQIFSRARVSSWVIGASAIIQPELDNCLQICKTHQHQPSYNLKTGHVSFAKQQDWKEPKSFGQKLLQVLQGEKQVTQTTGNSTSWKTILDGHYQGYRNGRKRFHHQSNNYKEAPIDSFQARRLNQGAVSTLSNDVNGSFIMSQQQPSLAMEKQWNLALEQKEYNPCADDQW